MKRIGGVVAGVVASGVLALSFLSGSADAALSSEPVAPTHLVIGLDLSKSNPLVTSDVFARQVADRLAEEIRDLPVRSKVTVRSFGVYDTGSNPLRIDQVISARARPGDVADGIQALVSNLPRLVSEGRLEAQMKTNIVPFLETMAGGLDCSKPTRIVLLTDGAEDSELGRLTRSGGKLPPAQADAFAGCGELLMLGLGRGFDSPSTTARFRTAWSEWSDEAGFERFVGLYDW
ncbi:hypothetical protein QMT40_003076 [Parvibaculaceae bacterium PLY_AMNH_Bact1]|nr:hypothetical protein QMT40_003076 [Parvibaculaceae bacterium PLY_AMNH_Bact1]